MYTVAIVTISDKGYKKERIDKSKEVIEKIIAANGFKLSKYVLIPDEQEVIIENLKKLCDLDNIPLIITTGGTGFSKRDITPEATKKVIEKETPGICEVMRYNSMKITNRAMLSRGVAGIRGGSLIINLPGSPKAAAENLESIIDALHHGLDILLGSATDCAMNQKNNE